MEKEKKFKNNPNVRINLIFLNNLVERKGLA